MSQNFNAFLKDEEKVTKLSSIIILIIKEIRLERGLNQSYLAENCGKTISAWTKIERGENPLTIEIFSRVCNAFNIPPSSVFITAERHLTFFYNKGWAIISQPITFKEDNLLQGAINYYKTERHRSRYYNNFNRVVVLNEPIYDYEGNLQHMIDVFYYVLFEDKKEV